MYMNSGTYCPLAFQHLYINNAGYLNPCARSYPQYNDEQGSESLEKRNVLRNGVRNSFESYYMGQVRQQMLSNQWPNKCSGCQKMEAMGIQSARQESIKEYPETSYITSMDLRLGNICNFKCRMCSPFSSVALLEEWQQSSSSMNKSHSDWYKKLDWTNWSEEPRIWDELLGMSQNLQKINFAGGEPFLNKSHVNFLKALIEQKKSSQISLSYNTNLSFIPPWLQEIIPHFKQTQVMVSMDGYDKLNEFIRHPSDWKKLIENLNSLDQLAEKFLGKLTVDIVTTIQVYNILYLDELVDFLSQQSWKQIPKWPTANILHNPDFLSAMILPSAAKQSAQEKLLKCIKKYPDSIPRNDFFQNVQAFLKEGSTTGTIPDFLEFNSASDKFRKQDYFNLAPEMAEYFNHRGV